VTDVVASQVVAEVLAGGDAPLRTSQVVLEVLRGGPGPTLVSALMLEVLRTNVPTLSVGRKIPVDTYPTFTQKLPSVRMIEDDMRLDRAINGSARSRAFYDGPKSRFNIRHVLSNDEFDTLLAFYNAHRVDPFFFVWNQQNGSPVQTFEVMFEGPPGYRFIDPTTLQVDVRVTEY
jgi:hypothetical protein